MITASAGLENPLLKRASLASLDLLFCRGRSAKYWDQWVCVSVCLSLSSHISQTTCSNFTKFPVHVVCVRSSLLLGQRCNTLCASGFVGDVKFHVMGQIQIQTRSLRRSELFTAPEGEVCYLRLACLILGPASCMYLWDGWSYALRIG